MWYYYRPVPIDYTSDQIPFLISLRYVHILFYQVALKNHGTTTMVLQYAIGIAISSTLLTLVFSIPNGINTMVRTRVRTNIRAQPIALKNAYTKIYTKNKVNDDVKFLGQVVLLARCTRTRLVNVTQHGRSSPQPPLIQSHHKHLSLRRQRDSETPSHPSFISIIPTTA
jgi:hypothetical protein